MLYSTCRGSPTALSTASSCKRKVMLARTLHACGGDAPALLLSPDSGII